LAQPEKGEMTHHFKRVLKRILPARLWTRLRQIRACYIKRTFRARQVVHTYGGVPLNIYLADPMSEAWYDYDWPELPEIAFLRQHKLKPGAKVFNLGAHQCVVALMLAKEVRVEGLVVAVEADAHNAAAGLKNRNLNQAVQLRVIHAAVAEQSGKVVFNNLNGQMVYDRAGKWGGVELQAFSIDDLARKYGIPDVLFIDVEGYECQALEGGRETLKHRPDCFVEVHVGAGLEYFGASVEQVLSFFPKPDYDLFVSSPAGSEFSEFVHLRDDSVQSRFFLLATARKSDL